MRVFKLAKPAARAGMQLFHVAHIDKTIATPCSYVTTKLLWCHVDSIEVATCPLLSIVVPLLHVMHS